MASEAELVISLNRLTMPSTSKWNRVTLSVVNPPIQHFIQNQKIVKGFKVNFYRQNLLIHEDSQQISFKLYGIEQDNTKQLLRTFRPSKKQLQEINKRPTLFHIQEEGYQLVWDSWIFTEQSSYMNQQSEKDYSELDLPFENKDPSTLSQIMVNSQSQNSRLSKLVPKSVTSKKRASSTEESSSVRNDRIESSESAQNKIKQVKQIERKEYTTQTDRKRGFHVISLQKKKKTHIKSHLYSNLVAGITELLSSSKS